MVERLTVNQDALVGIAGSSPARGVGTSVILTAIYSMQLTFNQSGKQSIMKNCAL